MGGVWFHAGTGAVSGRFGTIDLGVAGSRLGKCLQMPKSRFIMDCTGEAHSAGVFALARATVKYRVEVSQEHLTKDHCRTMFWRDVDLHEVSRTILFVVAGILIADTHVIILGEHKVNQVSNSAAKGIGHVRMRAAVDLITTLAWQFVHDLLKQPIICGEEGSARVNNRLRSLLLLKK